MKNREAIRQQINSVVHARWVCAALALAAAFSGDGARVLWLLLTMTALHYALPVTRE